MSILSNRINSLSTISATLAMANKSRELKAQGIDIINLSIGEPDFDTPEFIKESAQKAINDNHTHYTPIPGYQELREAVANKLKRDNKLDYPANQIVVSTGAKQSISNVFFSILNPGDEVIIPAPFWVSYTEMAKLAEGKPKIIETSIASNFKITAKQLSQAISPKTKALIFSSPCNPSGSIYSKNELQALAQVIKNHPNIVVISDEIYEHINFKGSHESIAQFDEIKDQVVVINGVSKGFAMTGWRIGVMAASKQIANACIKLQGQTTSGTNSIAQRAAIDAFNTDPKENQDLKKMVNVFKERRDLMVALLNEIPGLAVNVPNGTFYLFPNISYYFGKSDGDYTIKTANDLTMYILDKARVAVVTGAAFGNDKCIRLSYASSNNILIEAVRRIKEALAFLK
jgi:aspartate aminotransferase